MWHFRALLTVSAIIVGIPKHSLATDIVEHIDLAEHWRCSSPGACELMDSDAEPRYPEVPFPPEQAQDMVRYPINKDPHFEFAVASFLVGENGALTEYELKYKAATPMLHKLAEERAFILADSISQRQKSLLTKVRLEMRFEAHWLGQQQP